MLNYIYLNKLQRIISFLENYNHRICGTLKPFCTKIWISIIPWPVFISFIINEENNYRNILNENDNEDIPKIKETDKFYSKYYNNSIFKNSDRKFKY